MTKGEALDKLVSNILMFIDYDMWKEIYLWPDDRGEANAFINEIKAMISNYEAS